MQRVLTPGNLASNPFGIHKRTTFGLHDTHIMFEVPAAKRVKRSELYDVDHNLAETVLSSTSKKALDGDNGHIIPDYGFDYEFVDQTSQSPVLPKDDPEPQNEAYAFNLFRRSSKPILAASVGEAKFTENDPYSAAPEAPQPKPALISLRSPSPLPEDVSKTTFATSRPDSYYFTASLPASSLARLQQTYAVSATTGSSILSLSSTQQWPGTALPWRVISLPAHRKQVIVHKASKQFTQPLANATSKQDTGISDRAKRRARPSKTRRDMLKSRAAKRQISIDESKTKEEHEREKKKRKNREQKLKRRAKERKEKEERRARGETMGSEGGGSDNGSDGS